MNALSVVAIAFAMSTDAFAAAIGKGAALQRPDWREALRAGAIFGTIDALLAGLGAHMVWAGLRSSDEVEDQRSERHSFWNLAVTGFATSIDAMAVGVGLAFVDVNIAWVALAIGCATFVMVASGIMLGRALGAAIGKRAEIVGGVILVAIGAAIVYEHLHGAG
jgi:putative Mn2+ efflux pump MntP